jgi:LPPG:FO 2-phospho-L-lactate transferase
LAGETWNFLGALERLGGPAWFRLGDKDAATHVERSRRLWAGQTLTEITRSFCAALGVGPRVLPMTDDDVRTMVDTDQGELEFQEYFVHRRCEPKVRAVRYAGIESAQPTAQALAALDSAEAVLFCPSNPFLSLDPILSLPGVRERVRAKGAVAVSPIVGGQAVKGPAAKMLAELSLEVSAAAVAAHYRNLLSGFVLDSVDAALRPEIENGAVRVLVTETIMRADADRARLARAVLDFALRQ